MDKQDKMITIILPTYNRAELITRAIKSVLGQTYRNLELLIVDDASQDNTEDVVALFKDERIRYIKLKQNGGACRARNIGIQEAKGEYIAFLDSDDLWVPHALETLLRYIEEKQSDMVFSKFSYVDNKNRLQVIPNISVNENELYQQLLEDNFIANGAALLKANCLKKESFDKELKRFQDWDLYLRIIKSYKCSFCDEVLLNVFYQPVSITSKASKRAVKEALKRIYIKNENEIKKSNKLVGKFNWRIGIRSIWECKPDFLALKLGIKYTKHKVDGGIIYIMARLKLFYIIGKIL